jgi:glutathione-regulated potassium-efflux system ancillary protein KefF
VAGASTGGPEDSYRPDGYNRYFFDAFLPPYEQTAALVRHALAAAAGAARRAPRRRRPRSQAHAGVLAPNAWRAGPKVARDGRAGPTPGCDVPADARPQD